MPRRDRRNRIGLAVLVLWLAQAGTVAHGAEPSMRWFTITSPHFYVHYYKSVRHDLRAAAQKVAAVAERCHAVLQPIFRHTPSSRTHVVVTDDTDSANGSAQAIPYNIVRVYLTGPDSRSYLQDYDDWLTALIMHEYTHILHLDTIHGLPRLVNAVMGKIWAPNQLQPRWFIEGLAVYQETKRTSGGRLRASLFDMTLRAHVLEGKLLRLDQISSNTRLYPQGNVPYLYGAYFVQYLADRFGDAPLTKISHSYGTIPVPYALNRVAKEALGRTYEQLYGDFSSYLKKRYGLQKARVEQRGQTPAKALTRHGLSVGSPRYSPDGKELVYLASDGQSNPYIRIVRTSDFSTVEQVQHLGGHTVTFTPDGRYLVYGQGVNWRTFHSYHDLYVRRRGGGGVRQLTDGLRARDPDVSPDGAQVVFVTNELGRNDLALIPFAGGKHRVFVRGREGEQFFRPRFSPDGKQIVVSVWQRGGQRDIALYDLKSGRRRMLTQDRAIDMDPLFSRDGKRVFFSSDRTGIFNLYALDLASGRLEELTNVLDGVFGATLSPDERQAVYVGFGAYGFDLKQAGVPQRGRPALPYIDDRPKVIPAPRETRQRFPVRPYNPLRTAYPRSWNFSLGTDAFGTALGIELAGADVVERHRYLLNTNVSTTKGYVSYLASYTYNRFWPSFYLDTSRFLGARGGLVIDGRKRSYIEENYGFGLGLGLPVLRIPQHSVTINVGYRFNWFRDGDQTQVLVLPDQLAPRLPEVGLLSGVTASITYTNVQRYLRSVSPESGRQLNVSLRVDSDVFGSDYASTQVSWSWAEYIDIPFFDDHVLAIRYGGGIARGDFKRRGFFFIGGFPEQDIIKSVLEQTALGGSFLRGYPPGTFYGDQFHLVNVEYRFPLYDIERGMSSLPLYASYVHLAVFADVGHAFFGDLDFSALKVGVGGELLLEFVVGYFVPLTLRVGYARGLMEEGGNEFFMLIGRRF